MSTRDRILKEAGKLFYRDGVHAVGMEKICQSSGITKPTLYHHYRSKDDLITAYIQSNDHFVFTRYAEVVRNISGGAREKLFAIIDELERMASKPEWNGCAFHRLISDLNGQRDHPAYKQAIEHKNKWRKWMVDILNESNVKNSETLGRVLVLITDGALAMASIHKDGIYFDDAKEAMRLVLDQNHQAYE